MRGGGRGNGHQQARNPTLSASRFRNAPGRAGRRYQHRPGLTWPQPLIHDDPLHQRRHQNHRRSEEPARAFEAYGVRDASAAGVETIGLSQRAWLALLSRWRMSSAATVKPIARPMPAISIVASVA